jgi:hypothetical protein
MPPQRGAWRPAIKLPDEVRAPLAHPRDRVGEAGGDQPGSHRCWRADAQHVAVRGGERDFMETSGAPGRPGIVIRRNPKTGERHMDELIWGLLPHNTTDGVIGVSARLTRWLLLSG